MKLDACVIGFLLTEAGYFVFGVLRVSFFMSNCKILMLNSCVIYLMCDPFLKVEFKKIFFVIYLSGLLSISLIFALVNNRCKCQNDLTDFFVSHIYLIVCETK